MFHLSISPSEVLLIILSLLVHFVSSLLMLRALFPGPVILGYILMSAKSDGTSAKSDGTSAKSDGMSAKSKSRDIFK